MSTAFVLITSELGFDAEVLQNLKAIQGVKQAFTVYGVYDLIAKVQCDTIDTLKDTIHLKIRKLDHVNSTLTMIVIDER